MSVIDLMLKKDMLHVKKKTFKNLVSISLMRQIWSGLA